MTEQQPRDLQKLLTDIGLTSKETRTYLQLLKSGTKPISFTARRAGLNRGTTYQCLHNLLRQGLVSKIERKGVLYFTAQDPSKFDTFLSHKLKDLSALRGKLKDSLPFFEMLNSPNLFRPRIEFFTGVAGAKSVMEDTLTAKEKTLRAFLSLDDLGEFIGSSFFDDYTARRVKAGYTVKVIRAVRRHDSSVTKAKFDKRYEPEAAAGRIVKYGTAELFFPLSMYIYDEKVAVISSREENFAFILQSREFSLMQKSLFRLIWASL